MKVLIAPNSMKGSLAATDFAAAVEKAFSETCPGFFQTRCLPVADGGDGTAEVLIHSLPLDKHYTHVHDPLGRTVKAEFGYRDGIAVIEMASASGMKLLKKEELNPIKTSSFGTGQMILEAARLGARTILLGVGGSATVDGGMGMLEALGFRFYDDAGNWLSGNGGNLQLVNRIDSSGITNLNNVEIKIISDVDNPLLGDNGAARVFGPQKGASPAIIPGLEKGLANFANRISEITGTDISNQKGSGAAGGIAIGMAAFFGAEIVPGAEFILDLLNFDEHLLCADVVITGEGKFDSQSQHDKAPWVVAQKAKKAGKPVYAIVGINDSPSDTIFAEIFSLAETGIPIGESLSRAKELVYIKSVELALKISSAI